MVEGIPPTMHLTISTFSVFPTCSIIGALYQKL